MVSGSTGLTGAMDTVLVINRDSNGVTLYGRGRDIEEIETALQFERDVCRWRVLGDASVVRLSSERRAVLDALKDAGEPMTSRAVSDVTGHAYGATRKLLFTMARDGEVTKAGRGKYAHPDLNIRNIGNKVTSGNPQSRTVATAGRAHAKGAVFTPCFPYAFRTACVFFV